MSKKQPKVDTEPQQSSLLTLPPHYGTSKVRNVQPIVMDTPVDIKKATSSFKSNMKLEVEMSLSLDGLGHHLLDSGMGFSSAINGKWVLDNVDVASKTLLDAIRHLKIGLARGRNGTDDSVALALRELETLKSTLPIRVTTLWSIITQIENNLKQTYLGITDTGISITHPAITMVLINKTYLHVAIMATIVTK